MDKALAVSHPSVVCIPTQFAIDFPFLYTVYSQTKNFKYRLCVRFIYISASLPISSNLLLKKERAVYSVAKDIGVVI